MSSIRRSGTYVFRWNYLYLAAAFFVLHTVGAFGILSRLYYGEFQDGFTLHDGIHNHDHDGIGSGLESWICVGLSCAVFGQIPYNQEH